MTVDIADNYPTLINCLETGKNGVFLDLNDPPGGRAGALGTAVCTGPFSKTIPACIKTDGDGIVKRVHLVLQRDQYDTPDSLFPVTNIAVETAWENAFSFHQKSDPIMAPVFFRDQVNSNGQFQPFASLFHCRKTKRWFHPLCPQCGLALALCRDDVRLEDRGLPTYSESLERFLYCGSCGRLSASSPLYAREKVSGWPDVVRDTGALIAEWRHMLANVPTDSDFPCRGCPDADACYGTETLASTRIEPFSFFPFYMMLFSAPSCRANEFLPMISGADTSAAPWTGDLSAVPSAQDRFFFQDGDRKFLEVLYLKLTFLTQLYNQLFPTGSPGGVQEIDLSLEGVGVDINPSGAGLPAYWNFNVRILDAVGTFQISPFAPIMPEAPRLHFLGAVWFRTLLVNSSQKPDAVYAQVVRLLDQLTVDSGAETPAIDTSDPTGVFAGSQIFWMPDQHDLPENGQTYWKQALRLGFQLVHGGLRAGAFWDGDQFEASLDALRNRVKAGLFSGPVIADTYEEKTDPSPKLSMVLNGILQQWQAEEASSVSIPAPMVDPEPSVMDETPYPPDTGLSTAAGLPPIDRPGMPKQPSADTEWEQDIQETVVLSAADAATPSGTGQREVQEPQESQWNGDIEQTVLLRDESATAPPEQASPMDDTDRTVVISPPPVPPEALPSRKKEDLAATIIQRAPGSPPSSLGSNDDDLEATVIQKNGLTPARPKETPPADGDLETTIIQGTGGHQPVSPPSPGGPGSPPLAGLPSSDRSAEEADLDATVIINPAGRQVPLNQQPDMPPASAEDEFAATLIETPRSTSRPGTRGPLTKSRPLTPPAPPQPPRMPVAERPRGDIGSDASDPESGDDDITEQTIIIRSNVEKE